LGIVCDTTIERDQVLKPNYQFEKRRKELEKQKKKAEKTNKKVAAAEESQTVEPAVLPEKP
jgi:hypothetical protein